MAHAVAHSVTHVVTLNKVYVPITHAVHGPVIADAEVTLDAAIAHALHAPVIADAVATLDGAITASGSYFVTHYKAHVSVAHAICAPLAHHAVQDPIPIVHDYSNTAVNDDETLHGAETVYGSRSVTLPHVFSQLVKYHSDVYDGFLLMLLMEEQLYALIIL